MVSVLDVVDCVEKIIAVVNYCKKLFDCWKEKNTLVKNMRDIIESVDQSINKYKADIHKAKEKEDCKAFNGLLAELTQFKAYLDKNTDQKQKRNEKILRFFQGPDFKVECAKRVASLQHWMVNLNLSINIQIGDILSEVSDDIKKILELLDKSVCKFQNEFTNTFAMLFWAKYFESKPLIDLKYFKMNLKPYIYDTENMELADEDLEKIAKVIDSDKDGKIHYKEWDAFFNNEWTVSENKAKYLSTRSDSSPLKTDSSPLSPLKRAPSKGSELPSLTLIYTEANSDPDMSGILNYPLNHKFLIDPLSYKYKNLEGKIITEKKNLQTTPLIIGRPDAKTHPDISFHRSLSTVSRQQFQITASLLHGYFIKNLSTSNPTAFLVGELPFALCPGMRIELNGCLLLEVSQVFPFQKNENPSKYFLLSTDQGSIPGAISPKKVIPEDEKKYDDDCSDKEEKTQKRKVNKSNSKRNVFANVSLKIVKMLNERDGEEMTDKEIDEKIQCIKTIQKEKNEIILSAELTENIAFTFGSNKNNKIVLEDEIFDHHICEIFHDPKLKSWFIRAKNLSQGTLIFCDNAVIGDHGYKLANGMEIFFNQHVFRVDLPENF